VKHFVFAAASPAAVLLLACNAAWAGSAINAAGVVDYTSGNLGTLPQFNSSDAAVGALNGDTTYGGLNPFNPPFDPSQAVIVGSGGQLTLQLSGEVPANGRNLGVFVNNCIDDTSPGGTGQAGPTATTISSFPQAIVSVSQDGTHYVTLNGGAPITFSNPTNYWLNQSISNFYQALPADPASAPAANQYKPFLGTLASFNGETYEQMKTTLNGSAGGTWLNLSGSGLPAVNYVRFTSPSGSSARMVVDAVSGMSAAKPIVPGQLIVSESVGTGANTSHVVVDFGPQSYDFDVHYDNTLTGEDALKLIHEDSAFRVMIQSYSFGDAIAGMDYGGYVDSGFSGGYWNYYLSSNGQAWNESGSGAADRTLSDGSWDGWVWTGSQSTSPDLPLAATPEPSSLAAVGMVGLLLMRRRKP
jgi:hypothetical protein